jgi:hypothetical protein
MLQRYTGFSSDLARHPDIVKSPRLSGSAPSYGSISVSFILLRPRSFSALQVIPPPKSCHYIPVPQTLANVVGISYVATQMSL